MISSPDCRTFSAPIVMQNEIAVAIGGAVMRVVVRAVGPFPLTFHVPVGVQGFGALKRVLERQGCVPSGTKSDIYVPATRGGTPIAGDVDASQVLVHVSDDSAMLLSYRLWSVLERRLTRGGAGQIMPDTYIIREDSVSDDFAEFLSLRARDPAALYAPYILRSERGDSDGLYMSQDDLEDIVREVSNNSLLTRTFASSFTSEREQYDMQYTVVQRAITDPMTILRRAFSMGIVLALSSASKKTRVYVHRNGLVRYARDLYIEGNANTGNCIPGEKLMVRGRTREEVESIYRSYPKDVQGVRVYMNSRGYDSSRIFSTVLQLVRDVSGAIVEVVGNEFGQNTTINMYVMEVMLTSKGKAYVTGMKRASSIVGTAHDQTVLERCWEDMLKIDNTLLNTRSNDFTLVYEQ